MKIIISNVKFDYNVGCRLLKLKHNDTCPFADLEDIWNDIIPMTFKEIAKLENLEQRRVGVLCLGLERLANEIQPKLLDRQTLKKTTAYVDREGQLVTKEFDDTYELFEVDGEYFSEGIKNKLQKMQNAYYIKCKDTSTDREYFLWIEPRMVFQANTANPTQHAYDYALEKINAIQCIAWTLQTNVPLGNIEKIIRQGDCILVKPKNSKRLPKERHLTEKEYRTLLVAES